MKSLKVIVAAAGVLVLAVVVLVMLKMADHTKEFRNALYSGNVALVEKLLKEHPSLANVKNVDGQEKGWTPLHVAAYVGDAELAKVLLNHHAKVDAMDNRGLTPLLWTAFGGKEEMAAVLLSNGADVNARGKDGRTTLDLAKNTLNEKLIQLLRERGAKE
ncbi:ankyrin repeat domain-containing protein [Pedosphaera parvula]|uniref:Ankyrin n=1 Tax=Pedosphaera parvula (strain Ellin514) TaxID=320771 RepID=B9XMQ0_PEDPL|nr:ankyrin repeat domain-containing protein [Pedosphaera parvula]EEF58825.1 Ankyrin [Pedosphaera parvula Ellin514]